jgi:hypothetical protein
VRRHAALECWRCRGDTGNALLDGRRNKISAPQARALQKTIGLKDEKKAKIAFIMSLDSKPRMFRHLLLNAVYSRHCGGDEQG